MTAVQHPRPQRRQSASLAPRRTDDDTRLTAPSRRNAPKGDGDERPNHLRAVRPNQRSLAARRRRARRLLGTTAFVIIGFLFAIVASHVTLAQNQFKLEQLKRELRSEQDRSEQLRLDVATLSAPERIVREAQGRLGMIVPEHVDYLVPIETTPPESAAYVPSEWLEGES